MNSTSVTSTITTVAPWVVSEAARAAALWSGLALLTLLVLAFLVVRQRQKHKVMLGDGGVEPLVLAGRAFGNATEYVPAGMAALAVLALAGAHAWEVHLVGALLVLGRIAHAFGLSRSGGVSPGRAAGIMMTFSAFLAAGLALLVHALG